jgi:hypothetical protein
MTSIEARFHFHLCNRCGDYSGGIETVDSESAWKIEPYAWRNGIEAGYQIKREGNKQTSILSMRQTGIWNGFDDGETEISEGENLAKTEHDRICTTDKAKEAAKSVLFS